MRRFQLGFLLPVLFCGLLAACSATDAADNTIHPEAWPATTGGVPLDPGVEARVDAIMAQMTLEDKVAQTIQADIASITPDDIRTYRLGSILNGGNSAPGADVRAPAAEWLELADAFHAASLDASDGRVAIPIMWGTDAVHGHNNIVGATVFPQNIGLGATRNADLIRSIGAVTAREIRSTGQDWTFAPTLAVVRNDRWGRTYEGYSEDPEIVASFAGAMVEGIQGTVADGTFLGPEHVIATAKHFLGDGGTVNGVDQGDNVDTEADLRDHHGAGYAPAISAGVQSVMASFSSWYGEKLHGHKELLTDVLKGRMGFNGFVVGDWNGHGQVDGCEATDCAAALNAGLDMYMAPDSWRDLYENTLQQARDGVIPAERLDDAVRRILRVKVRMGLFEAPKPSERPLAGDFELLGAPEHLEVARQAVRESLVLLKNENSVLPIAPDQRVLVAGDGADDIGKQSGGWTLSWQGTGNSRADFPNGSSIWDGIRDAVQDGGGTAVLSEDGSYSEQPDVAVVVFGEDPYAEFMGDVEHMDFIPSTGLELLTSFREAGIPTVAVFLSGRPMWVNPELNAASAFVAAWLPGSQGAGVADVLVADTDGSVRYDFTGTLSYTWPKLATQVAVNRDDADYDPLFSYGYGLTYASDGDLGVLSEDPGLPDVATSADVFFTDGATSDPWTLDVDPSLAMQAVDHTAQENAQRFTWTEAGAIRITGSPVDLTRQSNGDVALSVTYRVDTAPAGPVTLTAGCGDACEGAVDMTGVFSADPLGEWTRTDVKLSCFETAGADMSNIDAIFGLDAANAFSISISDVRLLTNEGQAICPLTP